MFFRDCIFERQKATLISTSSTPPHVRKIQAWCGIGATIQTWGIYFPCLDLFVISVEGLPHLGLDPLLQVGVIVDGDVDDLGEAVVNSGPDDGHCDLDTDGASILDAGDKSLLRVLQGGSFLCQSGDGGDEHLVGDEAGTTQDGAQADARETDRVVALGDLDLASIKSDGRERRPRRHQGPATRPPDHILWLGLV